MQNTALPAPESMSDWEYQIEALKAQYNALDGLDAEEKAKVEYYPSPGGIKKDRHCQSFFYIF